MVRSQWDCLRQNLGHWYGSFATYDPHGRWQSETPSVVSLTETGQGIRQVIRLGDQERVLEFSTLSRQVLFGENGDFCQASLQFSPIAEFGIEFGFLHAPAQDSPERLRLIPMFQNGILRTITLIAEHTAESMPSTRPIPPPTPWQHSWQQHHTILYPDWRSPAPPVTTWAPIPLPTLLLPHGASLTYPDPVPHGQPFAIAAGWQITPQRHRRLICTYDPKGGWESLVQIDAHQP